jgi:hypothetical protein
LKAPKPTLYLPFDDARNANDMSTNKYNAIKMVDASASSDKMRGNFSLYLSGDVLSYIYFDDMILGGYISVSFFAKVNSDVKMYIFDF